MGVHGLWKLLKPSGKMVPLEALAGKVLAVDVSIWLHQAIKGVQDIYGAPVGAAHLLILFHRICKLLYYKIKPIFVFDGGVPALKQLTMAARRRQSYNAKTECVKIRKKLIKNLLKHEAVRQVLANETASAALGLNSFTLPGPSVEEDLYKLPPIAADYEKSSDEEQSDSEGEKSEKFTEDIHSLDVTSKEFLSLPPEIRHDILTELMETRKQNSWKNLNNMPKESDNFSNFQMNRLLKRHAVKISLEKAGKEIGGKTLSLKDLELLLGNQDVLDEEINLTGQRIAQDSVTRYMLIRTNSNVKKEKDESRKQETSQKSDILNHLEDVGWFTKSDINIVLDNCKEKSSNIGQLKHKKTVEENSCTYPKSCQISGLPKVRLTKDIADVLSILENDNVEKDVKLKVKNLQNRLNINQSIKRNVINDIDNLKYDTIFEEKKQIEKNLLFSDTEENELSLKSSVCNTDEKNCEIGCENNEIKKNTTKEKNVIQNTDNCEMKTTFSPHMDNFKETLQKNDNLPLLFVQEKDKIKSTPVATKKDLESLTNSNFNNLENIFFKTETQENDESQSDNTNMNYLILPEPVCKESCRNNLNSLIEINDSSSENIGALADIFRSDRNTEEDKNKEWENKNLFGDLKAIISEHNTEEQLSKDHLVKWQKSLEDSHQKLIVKHGKQERLALNLTNQIYLDAQNLLKLFGVPFIIAPMEAEAQCAALNTLGLTEGTITDDSDIWLFGGGVVYKNVFNQNKYVLEYKSDNIKDYFRLGREDLIKIAYLVGSDYTLGLNGIGPVTALEILASFPGTGKNLIKSLENFRDWFTGKNKNTAPRTKLKNKIKNTVILPGFPNEAVAEAYLRPQVDDSTEPFSWGKPNLDLIREFAKSKMGWSFDKSQDLLLPVLKRLEEKTNQSTLEKFFKKIQNTSSNLGGISKRVENAVRQLGEKEVEESEFEITKKKKLRKKKFVKDLSQDNEYFEGQSSRPKRKRQVLKNNSSEGMPEKPFVIEGEKLENRYMSSCDISQGKSSTESKIKIINEKLHRVEKIPQKERAQTLLDQRKKKAIKIFKSYKSKERGKNRISPKKEIKLSESSSED